MERCKKNTECKNDEKTGVMTAKEFVVNSYPNAFIVKNPYSKDDLYRFRAYTGYPENSYFSFSGLPTEEEAWESAKSAILRCMVMVLES